MVSASLPVRGDAVMDDCITAAQLHSFHSTPQPIRAAPL
jgi:hypothetical protein